MMNLIKFYSVKKIFFVYSICTLIICSVLLVGISKVYADTTIGLLADGEDTGGTAAMTTDINHLITQLPVGWSLDAVSWQGDIAYSGAVSTAVTAYENSLASSAPLFLVTGNHEAENVNDMIYMRQYYSTLPSWNLSMYSGNHASTTNFAYDVGDVRVIVVNQYTTDSSDRLENGTINTGVYNWVKQELKNTTKQHIVITAHEPAYPQPTGTHVGDSLDGNETIRDRFVNLMASYKVSGHFVGHTHGSGLYEMLYDSYRSKPSVTGGGIWELDGGAFGTKASGGVNDSFPSLGYFHTNSANYGDYITKLVQGKGTPDWAAPETTTKVHSDYTKQILVNTWDGSGTGTSSNGLSDVKYYVDYTPAVGANPDWSANNSGKFWESNFNATTAGWTSGELAIGYKNTGAPAFINTVIDQYGGLSTTTAQVNGIMGQIKFFATSTASYANMTLDLDYDDGVMVWLNGVLIKDASDGSVAVPTTGSSTQYFDKTHVTTSRNWIGTTFPVYASSTHDVTAYKSNLVDGLNTLSFWNINAGNTSSDLGAAIRLSISGGIDLVAPVISAVASSTNHPNTATISWTTDESSDTQVEYGLTSTYTASTTLDSTLTTSHSQEITGLATSTTYHFRVISKDSQNNRSVSSDYTFTTPSQIITGPATTTFRQGQNSYSGMIDAHIRNDAATTNYGSETVMKVDGESPYSNILLKWDLSSIPTDATITGAQIVYNVTNSSTDQYKIYRSLRPWTEGGVTWSTYDGSNSWGTAGGANSTTDYEPTILGYLPGSSVARATTTLNSSGRSVIQGWVDGSIDNHGFYIGGDTGLTDSIDIDSSENATVANRVALVIGYSVPSGPDITAPVISSIASSTTSNSATITWSTDENASSTIDYGASSSYGSSVSSSTPTSSHSVTLTGLTPSTLYHYRISVFDSSTNLATSSDLTFTTADPDITAPIISSVASSTSATTASVSWSTNESATSRVVYGTISGIYTSSSTSQTSTTTHSLSLSGLAQNLRYYFRVVSVDSSGNIATSSEYNFKTSIGSTEAYVAYVDLADAGSAANASTGNVLNFGSSDGASGTLIKYSDGSSTGVTIAITGSAALTETIGAEEGSAAEDGTTGTRSKPVYHPATTSSYAEFGEIVNLAYSTGITGTPGSTITVTLSGLDTDKLYTLVADGTRGKYSNRYCRFRLNNVASLNNNSSSGTTASTTGGVTGDSTIYNCGGNYANGYVAKWTDIDPIGTTMNLTITGIAFSGQSAAASYITALKLIEQGSGVDTTKPVISSIASSTASTTATITWTTDEVATSSVEFGLDSNYGSVSNYDEYSTSHSINLTGLSPETLYHFRVSSSDSSGNIATSSDYTFTTGAGADVTPPIISSIASSTTHNTANISWSTNESATSTVYYGLTSGYGSASSSSELANGSRTISLSGLNPSTAYHFQVSSTDSSGNIATSSDYIFTTTAAPDVTGPVISSINSSVSDITSTITWTTDENSTSRVSYGTSAGIYTNSSSSLSSVTSHSINITGLSQLTQYYYVVVSADSSNNYSTSSEGSFTTSETPDTTAPVISAIASTTSDYTSTITWNTDENSTSMVEYGLSSTYTSSSTLGASLTTSHSRSLTGLTPGTIYNFRVVSVDGSGNIATSTNRTFVTLPDTTGPVISNIVDSSNSSSSHTISWSTDEYATSIVNYGLTTNYVATTSSSATTTSHSVILSGLIPCTNYNYLVGSVDMYANSTSSTNNQFTTSGCAGSSSVEQIYIIPSVDTGTGANATSTSSTTSNMVNLSIPAGYAATPALFQIKRINDSVALSGTGGISGKGVVGDQIFDLKAYTSATTTISTFNATITISMTYRDADINNFDESTLHIHRWDGVSWSDLPNCNVNTTDNIVTCDTINFSTFGLFANTVSTPVSTGGGGGGSGYSTYNSVSNIIYNNATSTIGNNNLISNIKSPQTTRYLFNRNLKLGDSGQDVRELQRFLNNNGYVIAKSGPGSIGNETSYFGAATAFAVRQFQITYKSKILTPAGLSEPNGQFGPNMRRFVNTGIFSWVPQTNTITGDLVNTTPISAKNKHIFQRDLQFGDANEDVKRLQKFLNENGFTVSKSGTGSPGKENISFGPATKAALIRFQNTYASDILTPVGLNKGTGTLGPQTRAFINKLVR